MTKRAALAAILLSLPVIPSIAQAFAQQQAEAHPVVITFVVPINSDSVNQLIHLVEQQRQAGLKDIILVLASPGGETAPAFAAYNILKVLPINLTTFNVGSIDSAAMLLYCAGSHRYSLPGPGVRFLIHGNSVMMNGVPMDANTMDAQDAQLKNLNQMVIDAISSVATKRRSEVEAAVHSQAILTPEEAKDWGIVQDIRKTFMEPGASLLSVNTPEPPPKNPIQFTSIEPTAGITVSK